MWEAALRHRVLHSANGTFDMNEHLSKTLGPQYIPLTKPAPHTPWGGMLSRRHMRTRISSISKSLFAVTDDRG